MSHARTLQLATMAAACGVLATADTTTVDWSGGHEGAAAPMPSVTILANESLTFVWPRRSVPVEVFTPLPSPSPSTAEIHRLPPPRRVARSARFSEFGCVGRARVAQRGLVGTLIMQPQPRHDAECVCKNYFWSNHAGYPLIPHTHTFWPTAPHRELETAGQVLQNVVCKQVDATGVR
jgi:hypothetical protein